MHRQILIALGLALFAVACSSQSGAPSSPPPAAEAPGAEEKKRDAFDVDASVGADGQTLELAIRAKNGFKINDEYPHSFRPGESKGLSFSESRYELWEGSEKRPCGPKPEEICALDAKIPFDRSLDGEGEVTGIAAFSVCDVDICLIERVEVSAKVALN